MVMRREGYNLLDQSANPLVKLAITGQSEVVKSLAKYVQHTRHKGEHL